MSFKRKISAALLSAGLITGVGVVSADSASAASAETPVCYYKKTVSKSGLSTFETYNIVVEQKILQYPARTKMCHVVITKHVIRPILSDLNYVYSDSWIQVRY